MVISQQDRAVWATLSSTPRILTLKEICAIRKYASTNTAWRHMKRLEQAGVVVRDGHRAYRVVQPYSWVDL